MSITWFIIRASGSLRLTRRFCFFSSSFVAACRCCSCSSACSSRSIRSRAARCWAASRLLRCRASSPASPSCRTNARASASRSRNVFSRRNVWLLAWARIFVPSIATRPSFARPASRAIRTVSRSTARKSSTCTIRNRLIVRKSGRRSPARYRNRRS